jgi:hypothetical protein
MAKNYMIIRPEIMEFAEEMEKKMASHDRERGESWKQCSLEYLRARLSEEVIESYVPNADPREVIDVANFCMMIFHNRRTRGEK